MQREPTCGTGSAAAFVLAFLVAFLGAGSPTLSAFFAKPLAPNTAPMPINAGCDSKGPEVIRKPAKARDNMVAQVFVRAAKAFQLTSGDASVPTRTDRQQARIPLTTHATEIRIQGVICSRALVCVWELGVAMAAMAWKFRCRSHIFMFVVTTGICYASGGTPCWWRDTENAGILAGVQRLRGGGWFVPIAQLPTRVVGSVVDKVKHGREAAREKEVQDACRNLEDQKCAAALRGMAGKGYNLR
jgi:hypothetical protein